MPYSHPYDVICDDHGVRLKIITWQCHLCAFNNWNMDSNARWISKMPEKCRTEDCNHNRCNDCYDCDEEEVRLQQCDGAIVPTPNPSTPPPARTWNRTPQPPREPSARRRTFPCPLKIASGCDRVFRSAECAARHALNHNPVVPIQCVRLGCGKQFKRADDWNVHVRVHTAADTAKEVADRVSAGENAARAAVARAAIARAAAARAIAGSISAWGAAMG